MLLFIVIIVSVISNVLISVSQELNEELEGNNDYITPNHNIEYNIESGSGPISVNIGEDLQEEKKKKETINELLFTKTLLNGTNDDIKNLPADQVLAELSAIDKINVNLNKKLIIWDIVKQNKSVKVLKRSDLEKSGKLVLSIPEIDLYNLNYSDWDIIDYLGTLSGITRRRTGVVGYALKQRWGADIINKIEYINRMKGILCAFSPQELLNITPSNFCEISGAVFQNIKSCTNRQLHVLLSTAKRTTVYGPIQAWNMTTTAKLALLIKSLHEEDLKLIRPEAMEGISGRTIAVIPTNKLKIFNADQISCLDDLSLATYRRLTGINSNVNSYSGKVAQISRYLCYEVILIFSGLKLVVYGC